MRSLSEKLITCLESRDCGEKNTMSEGLKFFCAGQKTQGDIAKSSRYPCLFFSFVSKITIFILVFLLRVWKVLISPYLGHHCRFNPTCSVYAIEALKIHGLFRGVWISARRVIRCNPWSKGGDDPVIPHEETN